VPNSDSNAPHRFKTVDAIQAALREMAGRLRAERALLMKLRRQIRPPRDLSARQEGRLPLDVATDLISGIDHLAGDALPAVIESLDGLASVTEEELARAAGDRSRDGAA
jgi:hypothetical protein